MLIPAAFSLVVTDGHALAFGLPSLGALIFGAALFSFTRNPATYISGRDVFLMVVLGWLRVAIVGSLPFVLSGLMGPANALFEAMAGFTTTGASTVP